LPIVYFVSIEYATPIDCLLEVVREVVHTFWSEKIARRRRSLQPILTDKGLFPRRLSGGTLRNSFIDTLLRLRLIKKMKIGWMLLPAVRVG
jgi:hypothetical protein